MPAERVGEPRLLHANPKAAALIGLDPAAFSDPDFVRVFSGYAKLGDFEPLAMVYSGHQFGVWAGQLGDGRALLIGQARGASGELWDVQLKGAGMTPYSRFADGRAVMYGPTDRPDFRGIEGPEDHGVEALFLWDEAGKLLATAVNLACPSQEVEGESSVDADVWHEIRETLKARHGADFVVLGWTGAAGDQSPHLMYRKRAEERMRALRKRSRLEELAARVVAAWDEAHEGAKQEAVAGAPLVHKVESFDLPPRTVSEADAASAAANVAKLSKDPANRRRVLWHQAVVDRRRQQEAGEVQPYRMELHALRLGDVAIATNPFELYTQYGIQMKARSKALQTFLIQLAGPGSYLPTEPAVRGGGYSAIAESNKVGPEGGQVLCDKTVEILNAMWPE